MPTSERESLETLFDIASFLAKKGQPYNDFSELISLQKMHGFKFSIGYNNNKACIKFISFISKSIFEDSIKSKIIQSNFIAVLCDGSTDSAVVENDSIYVFFMDPDMFQPTLSFLYLNDLPRQDTDGIVKAIKSVFSIHDLHHLLQKMVFIASDGASVNSGLKGGIAAKFREVEELSWLSFIWCLLHRLEPAISDSLHEHLSSVKQCLPILFYL